MEFGLDCRHRHLFLLCKWLERAVFDLLHHETFV